MTGFILPVKGSKLREAFTARAENLRVLAEKKLADAAEHEKKLADRKLMNDGRLVKAMAETAEEAMKEREFNLWIASLLVDDEVYQMPASELRTIWIGMTAENLT